MDDSRAILEYERVKRRGRRAPWWRTIIIWELICVTMWWMALVGSVSVATGLASFVIPMDGMTFNGKPVETLGLGERLLGMLTPLVCGGAGIAFVLWHTRDMRRVRQSTTLCTACKQYVVPHDGECPDCRVAIPQSPLAARGEDSHSHEDSKKPLLLVLLVAGVVLISVIVPTLWERSRPGWGQRFQTTISVVDASDQSPLNISFGGPPDQSNRFAASYMAGPGFITVSWRYHGSPFPIEVSSRGYEEVKMELQPDSPTQISVPLRRLDTITPNQH